MRRHVSLIPALIAMYTLVGCITHHWVSPPIDGEIADSRTGKPISSVEIFRIPKGGEAEEVSESDQFGHFRVEAKRKTIVGYPVFIYLGDYWYRGQFSFIKEGFSPISVDYSAGAGDDFAGRDASPPPSLLKMTASHKNPEQ